MAWKPPESDRVESWAPPASDAPQDSTVGQRQQAARAAREARAPSWAQAFAPSTSAAFASGKNPLQDAATLAAPFKDLAALPANLAAGLLGFGGSSPSEGGLATREAMAGAPISPYAETQNQRVVGGLALAGAALGAPFLRAVPAATQAAIPEGASTLAALASRGGTMAKNAGRLVGAGVVESVPAATYQAATGDVSGGLASLALGGALRPLSGLPKAAPAAADMVERTAGALSGVPGHELAAIGPMGMSAYGREVKAAAGNPNAAYDLGQKLADRIKNFDQYLPNAAEVDAMVAKLPPIKANDITAALEKSKTALSSGMHATPADKATDDAIQQLVDMVNKSADKDGKIPATLARQIKQRYDAAVGDAFGKESSAYVTALKNGRHDIAKALESAAEESGVPEYKQAMKDYTRRLSAVDKISSQLGATDATRRARAESFVSNLYGKNKTQQQKNMADLADILGEDFAQQAKAIGTAKVAMPGGALPIFPTSPTGRSVLGLQLGSAATNLGFGNPVGAALSAGIAVPTYAMSSPALASLGIAGSRSLANLAGSPTANRATLASLASLRAYLQAENAQQ
jgi:hypothetical protein